MKHKKPQRLKGLEPFERRRDWVMFEGYAHMHVSIAGGPIHEPYEEAIQLFIIPWRGEYESWTVYRHNADSWKGGKIVFKKWDRTKDVERFRALGDEKAPKEWFSSTSVIQREFPVKARWVKDLELKVSRLSIPPISGPVLELTRKTRYRVRFWRGRWDSEFTWEGTAPKGWLPLARLFDALLKNVRGLASGNQLQPWKER